MTNENSSWRTYLEVKAMEEAAELQQSISKNMTFGPFNDSYYTEEPNVYEFGKELQDLFITIKMLMDDYGLTFDEIFTEERERYRKEKMKYYYENYWGNV